MARGLATIERALAADGPLTRQELGRRLHRAKIPIGDGGLIQLLFRAAIESIVVRGPMTGRQHA